MLKINNISTGYNKKQVLFDISLHLEAGDVVLLTGSNACGKSTLLKCIYNLLPLWSGSIEYENKDTSDCKQSDLIHKGMVYIPQTDFYFENLTVLENLQVSGSMLPKAILDERIETVVEETGLFKYIKRKPFSLSGGERKILAFGMGLIHKPKLLLFDEPFAGVDTKNTATISELFTKTIINPETGVIIVEHMENTKDFFTRKIKLELGRTKKVIL